MINLQNLQNFITRKLCLLHILRTLTPFTITCNPKCSNLILAIIQTDSCRGEIYQQSYMMILDTRNCLVLTYIAIYTSKLWSLVCPERNTECKSTRQKELKHRKISATPAVWRNLRSFLLSLHSS